VIGLGILTACFFILLLIKELVFIQQTRRTKNQFRLLLIVLFLNIGFVLLAGSEEKIHITGPFSFDSPTVFLILLIVVSVFIGFRNKWIHYLNKKSKLFLFFAGNAVFVFFLTQSSSSRSSRPGQRYAETAVSESHLDRPLRHGTGVHPDPPLRRTHGQENVEVKRFR
jgi:hypothetical protein